MSKFNSDQYKKYYQKNKDRIAASSRKFYLLRKYGITVDKYMQWYEEQDGCCSICGEHKPSKGHDGLVVDHNHDNGNIRGLLCLQCNSAVGYVQESVDIAEKLVEYLKYYREE